MNFAAAGTTGPLDSSVQSDHLACSEHWVPPAAVSEHATVRETVARSSKIEWFGLPGGIPRGMLTILLGVSGAGKSSFLLHLADALTRPRGGHIFGMEWPWTPPSDAWVIYIDTEKRRKTLGSVNLDDAETQRSECFKFLSNSLCFPEASPRVLYAPS